MLEVDILGVRPDTLICARCGVDTSGASDVLPRCVSCGADPRLDGRYLLLRRLGHGASGTTYDAVRVDDRARVAIKELLVRRLEDFKTHDLFRREAAALATLKHSGIPRYYDDFSAGEGRHVGLYLVTELIEGLTLEEEQKLHRHSQEEVVQIARELCDVLAYLHGLAPPVVHRDLKPSNVMRRKGGGLVLIDFGAVKESLREVGGSTVAGTFGFMPPEQLAGRATPATDLYALGVTVVVLMTRQPVASLIDDQNRLEWQAHMPSGTPLADGLRDILRDVLEPEPGKRLADARELARRFDALLAGRYQPRASEPVNPAILPGHLGSFIASLARVGVVPGVAEPPPPTPRKLRWGTVGKAEPFAGFFRLFGLLFGGIPLLVLIALLSSGVPGQVGFLGLFPLVGGTLATIGFVRAARFKRLYREGKAVEAVVTEVSHDMRLRVNGRSPHRITFRYGTPDGTMRESSVARMNVRPELRIPGAKVWALYDEKRPERVTMWPVE